MYGSGIGLVREGTEPIGVVGSGERRTAPAGEPARRWPEPSPREPAWPEFVRLFARLREESAAGVRGRARRGGAGPAARFGGSGVAGPITLVHGVGTLSALAASLARGGKTVVVLTDWDTEGGHLARQAAGVPDRRRGRRRPRGPDGSSRRRSGARSSTSRGCTAWARRTAEAEGLALDEAFGDVGVRLGSA